MVTLQTEMTAEKARRAVLIGTLRRQLRTLLPHGQCKMCGGFVDMHHLVCPYRNLVNAIRSLERLTELENVALELEEHSKEYSA